MNTIAPYMKAVVAFIAPGAVSLIAALNDDSKGGDAIVQSEWIAALLACVVTAAAVYAIPNRDPQATHQDESVQPPEAGQVSVVGALVVAVLVVLLLVLLGFIR